MAAEVNRDSEWKNVHYSADGAESPRVQVINEALEA